METARLFCILTFATGYLGGCAAPVRVEVLQPQLKGAQSRMNLQSDWAYHAVGERVRILLNFPLPGARYGEPQFELYLSCPTSSDHHLFLRDEKNEQLQGFFVQLRGQNAGATYIQEGELELQEEKDICRGRFRVICDDGTFLTGKFTSIRRDWKVVEFEERHPPSIEMKITSTSQPSKP